MNRYLLGAILGLIAVSTLYGLDNTQNWFSRSRESISASPSSAASDPSGINEAGDLVLRQTSQEAIDRARGLSADSNQVSPDSTFIDPAPIAPTSVSTTQTVQSAPATQPVAPATVPPANQEAIPALW